jgi:hypothetical protein
MGRLKGVFATVVVFDWKLTAQEMAPVVLLNFYHLKVYGFASLAM